MCVASGGVVVRPVDVFESSETMMIDVMTVTYFEDAQTVQGFFNDE